MGNVRGSDLVPEGGVGERSIGVSRSGRSDGSSARNSEGVQPRSTRVSRSVYSNAFDRWGSEGVVSAQRTGATRRSSTSASFAKASWAGEFGWPLGRSECTQFDEDQFDEVEFQMDNDLDNGSVDGEAHWSDPIAAYLSERLVFKQHNVLVMIWSVVLLMLLIYVGTFFLFRFAFFTFHLDENGIISPLYENIVAWNVLDYIVDALFWFDLIFNFFLSYDDGRGREVTDIRRIAKQYLMCRFWINLIACLPTEAVKGVMNLLFGFEGQTNFGVARVYRLQRISRLARLARLARLMKLANFKIRCSRWTWFKSLRGVRIINFLLGLVFTCHLMACGWYLVAALHDDPSVTWVGRRETVKGCTLLDQGPLEQWLTSMYFILTVFTTVGFGDISAVTEAEIVYIFLTMIVGAVVHSIIISEVIQVVMTVDKTDEFIQKHVQLLEAFSLHANLDPELHQDIARDLEARSKLWAENLSFDKNQMKMLLLSKYMPRSIICKLAGGLHCGRLCWNIFLSQCSALHGLPPRLPTLLAMHLHSAEFHSGDVVYELHDFSFYLGLVFDGTFACVGIPGTHGGKDAVPADEQSDADMFHGVSKVALGDCQSTPASLFLSAHVKSSQLFPYRLFGHNSYFGDLECMTSSTRKTTMRCEHSGKVLILRKSDLFELIEEFPQFGEVWAAAAWRRESLRTKSLKQLRAPVHHRSLAATTIQRFHREKRAARESAAAQEQAGQRCAHRSTPILGEASQLCYANTPHEFSRKDLKQIASPALSQTMVVQQVDNINRRLNKMHEEVSEVRSDIKGMKMAFEGLLMKFQGTLRL